MTLNRYPRDPLFADRPVGRRTEHGAGLLCRKVIIFVNTG